MDKLKKINEFPNILEYFYYLKDALVDFNTKKSNAVSNELKKFYSEQIDAVIKERSAIRDVVLTAKEQLVHNMMDNIKEEQVEKFIKSKKSEKERISKEKVDLELDIALSKSMMDFSLNVINPIAKDAKQFDSSDFFVYAESYNKKYLAKDDNNNLKEFSGTELLAKYLNNSKLLQKIQDRHNLKMQYLFNYEDKLRIQYPEYSEKEIYQMANDNLISHSPEFLNELDKNYAFSNEDFENLAKAYSDFRIDYNYIEKEDIEKKEARLSKLTADFENISKIPEGKDLESYLLDKFKERENKEKLVKTAGEILTNDLEIKNYCDKHNLLNSITLSPETKVDYTEVLTNQYYLLREIKEDELIALKSKDSLAKYEEDLNILSHSKVSLANIYTTENVINDITEIVDDYNSNYIVPLEQTKNEFEDFKNNNELALIPYQKVGMLQKIAGFFNGRNKKQAEFDNKCQMYEGQINILRQKAAICRPDYSFSNKAPLAKEIGKSIKDYFAEHPNCSDIAASSEVLEKYRIDLSKDISAFKETYKSKISELEKCSSYSDLSDCVADAINYTEKNMEIEKENLQKTLAHKNGLCEKYNANTSMPLSSVSTLDYLNNVENEYQLQLQKLATYKGENVDSLKRKINIENALKTDHSFISKQELDELKETAHKKAEQILDKAVNAYAKVVKPEQMQEEKNETSKENIKYSGNKDNSEIDAR